MKTILIIFIFISTYSLYSKWEYFTATYAHFDYSPNHELIFVDSQNNIWIKRGSSIQFYNGEIWKMFTFVKGIFRFQVNTINEDKNGNIWVGTKYDKTLKNDILFKFENNVFNPIDLRENSGFEDEGIYGIHFDEFNDPWVVTSKGIYCFKNNRWSWDVIDTLETDGKVNLRGSLDNNVGETFNYKDHILVLGDNNNVKLNYYYNFEIKKNKLSLEFIKNPINYNITFAIIDSNYNVSHKISNNVQSYYKDNEWRVYDFVDTTKLISLQCIDEYGNYYLMEHILYNEEKKHHEFNFYKYNNDKMEFLFKTETLQEDFEKSTNRNDLLLYNLLFIDKSGNYWFSLYNDPGGVKYTPEKSSVRIENKVSLYPNPSADRIVINSEELISKLELYSLSLSKIESYQANYNTSQELDISNLLRGVYFMKVNDDFYKFVKE